MAGLTIPPRDTLANALSLPIRQVEDIKLDLTSTSVSILRITKTEINNYGDEDYVLEDELVTDVILQYPLSEVELFENVASQTIDENAIDLWQILPIKMYIKYEASDYETEPIIFKKGDIILNILVDEKGNKIPIVMQIIRPMGHFFGKNITRKTWELSLVRGDLEDAIQQKIDDYVASYGQPEVSSINPTNGQTAITIDSNIDITFNLGMKTATVESALSIEPTITYSTSWDSEDKVLTINPTTDLNTNTQYTVTVTIEAKADSEITLDSEFNSNFITEI